MLPVLSIAAPAFDELSMAIWVAVGFQFCMFVVASPSLPSIATKCQVGNR